MQVENKMKEIVVDIVNCSRCGNDHKDLTFKSMEHPIIISEGEYWTHWASCPENNEPIIMQVGF